ncbi:fimbrial protein (plasmid) [Pantoea sp. BJ2]|uniref:Fimbrial protein n=1 Tax=Pantoea sp. BJ2 TaxID=3141322 RepID=A0AAU7U4L5_9GAMM
MNVITAFQSCWNRKTQGRLRVIRAIGFFSLMCLAKEGVAACTVNNASQQPDFPAQVTVPRNAAQGDVLAESNVTLTGLCTADNADESNGFTVFNDASNPPWTLSTLPNTVYDSSTGMGLLLEFSTDSGMSWPTAGALNDASVGSAKLNAGSEPVPFNLNARAKYVLVEQGKLSTGSLPPQVINFNQRATSGGESQRFFSLSLPSVNVIHETCDITTADITVDMDTVSISQFRGINSVAGSKMFNIDLQCDGVASIGLKFSGASASGRTDVLTLTGGSTATGVGVQILYDEVPVRFDNTTVPLQDPTNAGGYSIPLTARYIQTDSEIIGGKVSATASFGIVYL